MYGYDNSPRADIAKALMKIASAGQNTMASAPALGSLRLPQGRPAGPPGGQRRPGLMPMGVPPLASATALQPQGVVGGAIGQQPSIPDQVQRGLGYDDQNPYA